MSTEPKSPTSPQETRGRILDAAETLFADQGFRAVSLRQITTAAEVNLAAVNYHFGGKDGLIFEVLTRVVGPINEERLASLDFAEADAKGGAVPISVILDAFFRPVVDQLAGANHNSQIYLKLAGRCLSESEEHSPETLLRLFETVADRFVAACSKSLPHLNETDVYWRLHFSVGTLLHALAKGSQLVLFSRGQIPSVDPAETLDQLIQFTAGGMEAERVNSQKSNHKRKSIVTAAVAGCLFFLNSCSAVSPPDAKHFAQLEVPAHWIAGQDYRPAHYPDTFWVDHFGDKQLSAFVREALANNRDLKAADARIEIALANAKIAGADLYPQINGNFSSRRQKQNFIGFPFGGAGGGVPSATFNQFGLSLDLSWEIDLWGRIRAAESAAVAQFEASSFDRATANLSIAGQSVKAWFALAEARDQMALAQQTLTTFRDTEGIIRDRFEGGIEETGPSAASQLLLSEADIATAEDSLEARRELVGRTSRQLEVLAGKYPAGKAGKSARLPGFPSKNPIDLPGTLLDRRPDLAAAERRIAAADQQLLEAKRALLPALSLTSSGGTSSDMVSDLLDSNFSVWSIAGNVAQPILRGGVLRAGKARREAERELAAANFEQAALTAFAEVENALSSEKYLANRINSLSRAARLSEDAYNRSLQEYTGGTGDLLTLLTAQQTTFSRKSQLIALRRMRLENRVDLYLALGGSFQAYEPPPHKEPNES